MITDIVAAIYAQLAPMIADAGGPPLVDGKIVLGRQRLVEQSAPPRIIMIPVRSVFSEQEESASSVPLGQHEAWLARALLTDAQHFEVVVWAAATPQDPDQDFNATETLYKLFLRAVHQISHGSFALTDGEWLDQRPEATQLVKLGHQFGFGVAFQTPVQDDSLSFVPDGTTGQITTELQPADGSPAEAP